LLKVFQQFLILPEKIQGKFISVNEGFKDRFYTVFMFHEFGTYCSGSNE